MKFLVFAIVVLSAASTLRADFTTPSTLEDFLKITDGEMIMAECLVEGGVDEDSVASLATSSDWNVPESELQCVLKCFYVKKGFMDSDGNLQQDAIIDQLLQFTTQEHIDTLVQNCFFQEPDACDTANKVTQCYFQNKAGLF
ncbi:uncharacterized protein LOC131285833 [Anopheles ziemanni]|uniref:uncharacterized protein LOC131269530 n=1 Tax=Anopheles coustani TaxID=139045 RepID=UPI00265880A2|nr:uncharacterized protein LOC131269530 [Anopheles coustani]XP_058170671.1 uncharacterized protein LOC131285833 [Anopheles ziemanni]